MMAILKSAKSAATRYEELLDQVTKLEGELARVEGEAASSEKRLKEIPELHTAARVAALKGEADADARGDALEREFGELSAKRELYAPMVDGLRAELAKLGPQLRAAEAEARAGIGAPIEAMEEALWARLLDVLPPVLEVLGEVAALRAATPTAFRSKRLRSEPMFLFGGENLLERIAEQPAPAGFTRDVAPLLEAASKLRAARERAEGISAELHRKAQQRREGGMRVN